MHESCDIILTTNLDQNFDVDINNTKLSAAVMIAENCFVIDEFIINETLAKVRIVKLLTYLFRSFSS